MIGVFDSGLGGLTVLRALVERLPDQAFTYLGDHANVPYGNRDSDDVVELTRQGVAYLFSQGCALVILGCNTATAVAARRLQQTWLPNSQWKSGHNILGIVAPTVEAATQTPWAVTTPQYPQKNNTDDIVVFGTTRTIQSGVYPEEIYKRCPKVNLVQKICAGLAGAVEKGADQETLDTLVKDAVHEALARLEDRLPDQVILGCTHYPLVEHVFRQHLPQGTHILSQPEIVADSLADYLKRHPDYRTGTPAHFTRLLTTGSATTIDRRARIFWPDAPRFAPVDQSLQ